MNTDRNRLLLYAVTDRTRLNGKKLADAVHRSIDGGVTFVQLREKHLGFAEFVREAEELKILCRSYDIPFVINDSVDVAEAVDADGVHIGQSDMKSGEARKRLGPHKIIGVSVQTAEQAVEAEKNGADYLGVGAVFPTSSKDDADSVSYETLKAICSAVSVPVVAIGGINCDNADRLAGSGICGIAVISAIFAAGNIRQASAELRIKAESVVNR